MELLWNAGLPANETRTNRSSTSSTIKAFSQKARQDPELGTRLKACVKVKQLILLGKEVGFELDEVALYPPNEPEFTQDQLSPQLVDALLRV